MLTRLLPGRAAQAPLPCRWEQLLEDEEAFVAAADALDTTARLPTSTFVQLAERAWQADMPHAVASLQRARQRLGKRPLPGNHGTLAALGGAGWEAGKPRIGMLAVTLGRMSAAAYTTRFPAEQACWAQLVDGCFLSPQTYLQRFGNQADDVRRWLRQGLLTPTGAARALIGEPEALMPLLVEGALAPDAVFAIVRHRAQRDGWIGRLLEHGLPLPPTMVVNSPELAERACMALRAGTLPMEAFLACVPRPGRGIMEGLADEGLADPDAMLRAGALSREALEEHVAAGRWTPVGASRLGPIPLELADAWLRENRLDRDGYLRDSVRWWQPDDALPTVHIAACLARESVGGLLRESVMPARLPQRRAFAQRLLAVHLQGRAPLTSVAWSPEDTRCSVCYEDLDAEHPGVTPGGCEHPATMCGDCLRQAVTHAAHGHCPYEGCVNPLSPEDARKLGAGPRRVQGLAASAVRRALQDRPDWVACTQPDCCGGVEANLLGAAAPCPVCREPIRRSLDWQRDRSKVRRLLADLDPWGPRGERPIRECYHCGVPTQHDGGCSHMHCASCHRHWDFNGGPDNWRGTSGIVAQQYVPRAGLLRTAGLYAGVEDWEAGRVIDVPAHVRARAAAQGWLAADGVGNTQAIVPRRRWVPRR